MSGDQESTATEITQRQVRVQLTTQQEDIALPESTGPILVPTGKNLRKNFRWKTSVMIKGANEGFK
jgi:hypothetical protein